LASAIAAALTAAAGLAPATALARGRGFDAGSDRRAVVRKTYRVAVPAPGPVRRPERTVRERRSIAWPRRDETGAPITARPSSAPPAHHAAIARDSDLARGIRSQQRVEVVPRRYYWHADRGVRYCHYYDGRWHWYGFYFGPAFYWTRYYDDRWWWFDASFGRWVYWWDGYWWWWGPDGAEYVYIDNAYYPYDASGVTVVVPETDAAPPALPASSEGSSSVSPDGRRMVQLVGPKGLAFLYDRSSSAPVFMKFLGKGVERVRYSGGKDGVPLRLLLEFKDAGFALFDADGAPLDAAADAAKRPPTPPPDAPESIPPPPTAAPGR
jgi:hypothetical protein